MPVRTLDLQGLACPLPVLKTRKALKEIALGDDLEVLATDPGAKADFPALCYATGNQIIEQDETSGIFRFLIKRCT